MNIQTIEQDIDFLCGSTSATYPVASKIRNVNICYQDVARVIWESEGAWSFDDSNNTTLPVAYKTLGQASAQYVIPTTAFRVEGVEVLASGNWRKLQPISFADFTDQNYPDFIGNSSTPGLPSYYRLEGNTITLYPSPASASVTLASGMQVLLARSVTEFAVSATTTLPGFVAPFHRILSYGASIDFSTDENDRNFFIQQRDRLMTGLQTFYSKRGIEYKTRILPAGKKRWRNYI